MKCPFCGGDMHHGNITGSKVLRLVPDSETPKEVHRIFENADQKQRNNGLEGNILNVPYHGLAPWIPADYCKVCNKVIFTATII